MNPGRIPCTNVIEWDDHSAAEECGDPATRFFFLPGTPYHGSYTCEPRCHPCARNLSLGFREVSFEDYVVWTVTES